MTQLPPLRKRGFHAAIMAYSTARSRLMSLLGAFALLAIVVRGLVPAGYMVAAPAEPGQFVNIVICHGDGSGLTPAVLDLKTGKYVDADEHKPGQSDAGKNGACPFALTAHFALPDLAGDPAAPVQTEIPYRASFAPVVPGRGLAAPPPPARGPPLTI
jgi:hypothetical protein